MPFDFSIELTWLILPLILLVSFGYLRYTFFSKKKRFPNEKVLNVKETILFSPEELSKYDNSNPDLPVYLAIKGIVFDVSSNRASYPHKTGYGIFAGKDASRALAKSSLKVEDCVPEWTDLPLKQVKVLDDWYKYYNKKYPIVGQVRK